jgi:hypothetical protein
MVKAMWFGGVALIIASAATAQSPAHGGSVPPAAAPATAQARFQIRNMEAVLENAVQHGAQTVSNRMRMVSPDIALFSGPARARGFRLESYGAFFAVDVPALHRSVTWTVRTLSQSNGELTRALQQIRRMVQTQNDDRMKTQLEQALRLVELQVVPPGGRLPGTSGPATQPASAASGVALDTDPSVSGPAPELVTNPGAAYTESVQHALIEAMLTYGSTLNLRPDEWLTVAARENTDSMLAGDLSESVTVTLRVKASDLQDLAAGRLTNEDVRQRVEVREF